MACASPISNDKISLTNSFHGPHLTYSKPASQVGNALLTGTLAAPCKRNMTPHAAAMENISNLLNLFQAVVDIHSSLSPAPTNFKNIQLELTSTHDLMWWVYQGLQQPEPGAKGNTMSRPRREQARFTPVREWLHGSTEAPCLTGECASPLNSWNSYCYFISFIFLDVPPHSRKKLQ